MPDLTNDGRMKGRQKGGDRTVEDAFKTMERFTLWLETAQEQNVWLGLDPLQTAMLYRFLEHLQREIGGMLSLGGEDARHALELFQLMNTQPTSQNDRS